jgi:DeoR/GlpR family transcriptional regulator of sugar metabolism
VRLLVTGGFVRPDERSLVGQPAEDAFRAFHFDLAFLTVGGIDLRTGVTEYNVDDARVKRAALESAARTVAVADSSKLNRVAFARVCAPDEFDVLVTDDGAPARVVEGFEKLGVQVIIA